MTDEREDFALGPTIEFMQNLWRVNHALERLSRRMEAAWGVTTQQRMIIRCVGKYPGMTASQLARQFYVDAGTVSTALARLERKGLLERRRADRDRRRLTLGLTARGRSIDHEAGTLEQAVESLLRSASGEDVASTGRVLDQLTGHLETADCKLSGPAERGGPPRSATADVQDAKKRVQSPVHAGSCREDGSAVPSPPRYPVRPRRGSSK